MEGNEIEKAADQYSARMSLSRDPIFLPSISIDFTAGANWQRERENAELTRAQKRIKELDDKYLKLSQKYADLHKFAYGMVANATKPKDSYLNEEI